MQPPEDERLYSLDLQEMDGSSRFADGEGRRDHRGLQAAGQGAGPEFGGYVQGDLHEDLQVR